MSPPPKGKQTASGPARPRAADWTSAVVGVGLALLAVLGVLTVFSGPLLALVAPSSADEGAQAEPERPPHGALPVGDGGAQAAGGAGARGHS